MTSPRESRRLEVKTTVEIPKIGAPGLQQGGVLYISIDHVSGWLEATAAAFDEAHAMSDIGGVLRACAAEVRGARVA